MSQDYIALEWVKGEIEETLQQARQTLEAYVENPQDKSRLKFCLSYLHQIHGTLQMVEFYGAALLAEEMEAIALAMTEGTLKSEREGLEILMQAIIQLPHYLEHVKVGRRDLPVVLLPILNELRSARGEAFLSETALFAPKIPAVQSFTPQQLQPYLTDDFLQWARKLRQMLQAATLQLLQNKQPDVAKQYLNKVFARLHKALGRTPQGQLWLPALAFSDWLLKQQNVPSSAKQLLRQLDNSLKTIIDDTGEALNQQPSDELLKNLLFYVARTEVKSDAIQRVQEIFGLRHALPTEDEIRQEQNALARPDRDTVGHVLGALVEEIAAIKDRLDLLVRSDEDRLEALATLSPLFKQVADTMGMLGLGMPRKVMQEQQSAVTRVLESGEVQDGDLLDIAGALLYVEATISGMQSDGDLSASEGGNTLSDAQKAVLREARNVLEQVKDAIVEYIAKQWSLPELQDVPYLLHSIEGSLSMIPLPRVATILARAASFVQYELIDKQVKPEWAILDILADVLSGIEYFIERYSENPRSAGEDLLIKAEKSLQNFPRSDDEYPESKSEEDFGFDGEENLPAVISPFGKTPASDDSASEYSETAEEEIIYAEPEESNVHALTAADSNDDDTTFDFDDSSDSETDIDELVGQLREQQESGHETHQRNDAVIESAADDDDDLIDDEIIEIFLEEAEEVGETLNEFWPQFKADHNNQEALTTVRRAYHTLKGSGRMVRAESIGELAWSVENMFNRVLDQTISITPDLVALVDYVISQLPLLIDDFRQHRPSSVDTQPLMDYAFALAAGELVDSFADPSDQDVHAADIAEPVLAENDDEDDALLEVFEAEACSHLMTVDEFVQQARAEEYFLPLSDQLQRALHTLKGSAHMAGITPIANVASPLERLVKELKSYQVSSNREIVDLLEAGSELIANGLSSRELLQAETLAGTEDYLQRIDELEVQLLAPLQEKSSVRSGPNPQAIAQFLAQGMDSLLDADRLLLQWQRNDDSSILQKLCSDLRDVTAGAAEAEAPNIHALAETLNTLYQRIEHDQAQPESGLLRIAGEAHEAILSMMDCLAAGQETQPATELIERIREWQFPLPDDDNSVPASSSAGDAGLTADASLSETDNVVSDLSADISSDDELPLPMVDDGDDEILDIFLEEAQEIAESVETAIQQWRENPQSLVHVAQLQRELHTLKGGARMAELAPVADLCHELETLYENISNGRLSVQPQMFELMDRAHDELGAQIDTVHQGKLPAAANDTIQAIRQYLKGEAFAEIPSYIEDETPENEAFAPATADPVRSEALDESDREILDIFLEEANELQDALDRTLNHWSQEPGRLSEANEALRILHTLKGGARLAGLTDIGNLAHEFEADILKAQQGQIPCDDDFFQAAYRRHDELNTYIEHVATALESDGTLMLGEKSLTPDETDTPVINTDMTDNEPVQTSPVADDETTDSRVPNSSSNVVPLHREVAEASEQKKAAASSTAQQSARKAPQELVKVSADLLDNLVNLAGETSIGRGRLEQQVTDFAHTLDEMDMTLDRLRDQLRRLDMETEAQVLFRQERQGPDYEDFDPLEMDRYSTMQQLSRALVESASDLLELKENLGFKTRDTETLLLQQSRVNTELQEGLMKTRMVPFQRLVPRLRRIVRQVSLELDKQVELRVFNAEGEMDRTILERMISPLEHMVRNAVDHGIESRQQRTASGKTDIGYIDLEISRDGGDVVLTLTDDGRGVNLEAVRKKAIERGLVDAGANLSDQEIMQFILQAGFSTAESVTQISGRGVGMDVVSSEIKQMGGTVEIQSETGSGTRFVVRLPFTVSVNRALMVRVGDDLYAVPLNNIQGIVRMPVAQMQSLYEKPATERLYQYAGVDYRTEYLGYMLENEAQPKFSAQHMPVPLLLIRGAIPFALQVDSLMGSREIVVKTLGPQFAGVMGVSGGTILGDGSVVIILDLPAMIRTQVSLEYQQAKALDNQAAERRHGLERRLPRILVVDDSVTVRKVTTRLLERNGLEVFTAKDGVDAMATLQDHKPDLMLLDIEMPRMDGFEVASLVRHDSRLKDIPIIMITSRTGDKHRERAMSIGVNEYMGKPFQEDGLLGTINRLLGLEDS